MSKTGKSSSLTVKKPLAIGFHPTTEEIALRAAMRSMTGPALSASYSKNRASPAANRARNWSPLNSRDSKRPSGFLNLTSAARPQLLRVPPLYAHSDISFPLSSAVRAVLVQNDP